MCITNKYIPLHEDYEYLYGVVPVRVSQREGCDTCFQFDFHKDWDVKASIACSVLDALMSMGNPPCWEKEFNAEHSVLINLTSEQIILLKELTP